jgi:hypothetical protein
MSVAPALKPCGSRDRPSGEAAREERQQNERPSLFWKD